MKKRVNKNGIASIILTCTILLAGCTSIKEAKEKRNAKNLLEPVAISTSSVELPIPRATEEPIVISEEVIEDIETETDNGKVTVEYGYMTRDFSVWDSIEHKLFAGYATQYQKVAILSTSGEYSLIEFVDDNNNLITGYVMNDAYKKLPGTFIAIDISTQTLNMYIDNELVLTTPVVTGQYNTTPTNVGYFSIYGKDRNTYLTGVNSDNTKYISYVDYWMPFDGNIGLHDAEHCTNASGEHGWREPYEFGGYTYTFNGSHGCVNLLNDAAKEIYENSEVGTKVLVHK